MDSNTSTDQASVSALDRGIDSDLFCHYDQFGSPVAPSMSSLTTPPQSSLPEVEDNDSQGTTDSQATIEDPNLENEGSIFTSTPYRPNDFKSDVAALVATAQVVNRNGYLNLDELHELFPKEDPETFTQIVNFNNTIRKIPGFLSKSEKELAGELDGIPMPKLGYTGIEYLTVVVGIHTIRGREEEEGMAEKGTKTEGGEEIQKEGRKSQQIEREKEDETKEPAPIKKLPKLKLTVKKPQKLTITFGKKRRHDQSDDIPEPPETGKRPKVKGSLTIKSPSTTKKSSTIKKPRTTKKTPPAKKAPAIKEPTAVKEAPAIKGPPMTKRLSTAKKPSLAKKAPTAKEPATIEGPPMVEKAPQTRKRKQANEGPEVPVEGKPKAQGRRASKKLFCVYEL
ncbi:hypothetical protein TWF481_001318 [Arthrobotrys musiformis]|uniref:Uncharacterized protein n=1 Tax=Arthrobotrys musiformis TaxID=47236 RepID=A0AAV9WQ62_9PEZI